MNNNHFFYIFWFIVGLCLFGAGLTIFLIMYLPIEEGKRIADTALIFWLSTAVSGGIGYLIGSSANKKIGQETTVSTPENSDTKTTVITEQSKNKSNE